MDDAKINEIVESVIRQLALEGIIFDQRVDNSVESSGQGVSASIKISEPSTRRTESVNPEINLTIDLKDPASEELRYKPRVVNPKDPASLKELIASTTARIGVGRSGPRYNTFSQLLFQGDHAVTQDALYRDVDSRLLEEFNLLTVQTKITEGKEQYLLRPDLGRQLSEESKKVLAEKCTKNPNIQLVIGDGLSATAIESNLRQIFPVITQGIQNAGLTLGTPFFVKYCRVGVINDIGDVIHPDVIILLIGERPGLGRAESMSAYLAYQPGMGQNDSDRDVICNIFENGGTNPLEAGAFIVQFAQKMRQHQASGVKLKLATR
jgi:ethanolamine ammonia-lyase small subunit